MTLPRSLVATSVFEPDELPKLDSAKSHACYLCHSKADWVRRNRMAEQAERDGGSWVMGHARRGVAGRSFSTELGTGRAAPRQGDSPRLSSI